MSKIHLARHHYDSRAVTCRHSACGRNRGVPDITTDVQAVTCQACRHTYQYQARLSIGVTNRHTNDSQESIMQTFTIDRTGDGRLLVSSPSLPGVRTLYEGHEEYDTLLALLTDTYLPHPDDTETVKEEPQPEAGPEIEHPYTDLEVTAPALLYVGTDRTVTAIDREGVRDGREARVADALIQHALILNGGGF